MNDMYSLHDQGSASGLGAAVTVPVLLAAAVGYLLSARRARYRKPAQGWNRGRSASFLSGLALLAVALLPPLAPTAHTDFAGTWRSTCSSACTRRWPWCCPRRSPSCYAPCRRPRPGG